MNVTLPSGRTISDVPDGTTQKDLLDRLARAGGYEEDVRQMQLAKSPPIGEAGFRDAAKKVAGETGVIGRGLQGIGETFDRYAYGAKGLFTDLSPEEKKRLEQNKVMAEEGGAPAMAGQIIGDVAITAPLMAATGGAAASPLAARTVLPKALGSLPGRVATTIAPNAALGALSAPEARGEGALYGGIGGAAGGVLNRAVGGVVKPFISREAKELIEQGIQPTPGQAVGGAAGKLEEKLGSVPIVGDIIGKSRNRAIREYNEALAGRASQAVTGETGLPRAAGRKLGEAGDEALGKLREQIGETYEEVLGSVPKLRIERSLVEKAAADIASDPALALSDASAKRLFDYVEKNLLSREREITGDVAKRMESDIRKAAGRFKTSSVGEERAFGEALDKMHAFWRQGLMGSLPPEAQQVLKNANAAWAGFQPLDVAAATAASQQRGGVFTPRVLRSALAKGDKSQSDNALRELKQKPVASARNPYEYTATMARAGQPLGDVVPDSGTAGRVFAGALAGGGMVADLGTTLGVGTATSAATALAYSRAGAKLITQGAIPATREAVSAWLESQGVPRTMVPMLTEQTLAAYSRSKRPLPRSLEAMR